MDPLSITTSTVALIGMVATVADCLKKLASLRHASVQILQLCNEVADFHQALIKTRKFLNDLPETEDESTTRRLARLIQRGNQIFQELERLLEDHVIRNYRNVGDSTTIDFSLKSWLRQQSKAQRLLVEIRAIRTDIDSALILFTASTALPHFQVDLHRISFLHSEILTTMREFREIHRQQSTLLQHAFLPTLQNVESSLQRLQLPDGGSDRSSTASSETLVPEPLPRPAPLGFEPVKTASAIRVDTTLVDLDRCGSQPCGCRCHKVSRYQHHPAIAKAVGSLFVGYSGVPLINPQECNVKSCKREPGGQVRFAYFFPTWVPFVSRMVSFVDKWSSLDGHRVSLEIPRVVPASSEIFILAQKGNIDGIRHLMREGKASIYDVNATEGRSALHFALTAGQPAVAEFLLTQSALSKHIHIEDKNFLSAVDVLWNYLLEDPTHPVHQALRVPFAQYLDESEDLQKRQFSTLHRTVFGFTAIDLEALLEIAPEDIDRRCSLGRTPLCWAASRRDPNAVRVLVDYGAALHIADRRGQSAFHLAAEMGTIESLRILLAAATIMASLYIGAATAPL